MKNIAIRDVYCTINHFFENKLLTPQGIKVNAPEVNRYVSFFGQTLECFFLLYVRPAVCLSERQSE